MKKKLLVFTNSSGGLYLLRRELLKELSNNYDIVVSSPFDGMVKELEENSCRLIETSFDRRGLSVKKDINLLKFYRKLLKQERPSLVITYTIKPNIYGSLICRMRKIPYAANITGLGTAFEKKGVLRKAIVFLYKRALKRARVVFFENSENRDFFVNERIVKIENTCVLHGAGVNLDHFFSQEYPHNDVFKFLFIGRIMKEKGIDELFRATKALVNSGIKCSLDLVGGLEESYGNLIKEYETEGWLKYNGFQHDVRPFIGQCDCLILPSWHEGMSNSNLEAAASCRPIITSNIPGCREAVVENVSGYLCEPNNADSLYDKMLCLINTPFEERVRMGLAGRRHMENLFDKNKVVAETIDRLEIK